MPPRLYKWHCRWCGASYAYFGNQRFNEKEERRRESESKFKNKIYNKDYIRVYGYKKVNCKSGNLGAFILHT